MHLYNLYQDHAIKLHITSSRIIQLQIIIYKHLHGRVMEKSTADGSIGGPHTGETFLCTF